MKGRIRFFLTAGFFFTCIVGTVMHFVYAWSGNNFFVGMIAPVNESTWEHLKLLFFPAAVWTGIGCIREKEIRRGMLPAAAVGICAGMLTIVTVFYTYTGIVGTNLFPMDIFTFILGVFVTFLTADRLYQKGWGQSGRARLAAVAALVLTALLFFRFTAAPPDIGLFRAAGQGTRSCITFLRPAQ